MDRAPGRSPMLAPLAAALLAAAALAVPTTAAAQDLGETCREPEPPAAVCVGAEKLAERGSAECRRPGALSDEDCALPAGARVSSAAVDEYESSWTHRALGLQYELASDVGMANAPWIGTHNSFNSTSEPPTVSHTDSNQQLSLAEQLRIDVRSLELDIHYIPSARAGGFAPVVCHGTEEHAGCTSERLLGEALTEIVAWLHGHPDQVLLLYLEDDIGADEGYEAAAEELERVLRSEDGSRSLIHRPAPAAGGCSPLPLDVSRADVLAAGAQVVIVSNCGPGPGWRSAVFDWDTPVAGTPPHVESGSPTGYDDGCAPEDFSRDTYEARLVRYFEDSTWVGAMTRFPSPEEDRITPAIAASMARCGVDLLGMDQLLPGDGRLEALVWSWAPDEPRAGGGDCSVQLPDGRWVARPCSESHRAACRAAGGGWTLTEAAVAYDDAALACAVRGVELSVPRTGRENELLKEARRAVDGGVWLGQRLTDGRWQPADER